MLGIQLTHFFDPLHETRKFFKLRPLFVGGLYRHVHLNRCDDV